MSKVKIITDSVSDIPKEIAKKWDIEIVPLTINFQDECYKDGVEISIREFYDKLKSCETLPTTSQVSPLEFINTYKKFEREYEHMIVITMSSELSGTFQSAVNACEIGGFEGKVSVIDSKGITLGQGLMALEASKMAKDGKTKEEIIYRLNDMVSNVNYIFVVDTLENLKKGGRLSATKAFVGEKLKIKPVLTMEEGKLIPTDKIRGRKKVINWIIKEMEKSKVDFSKKVIGVNHTDCEEFALELIKGIREKFEIKEIILGEVGCTVATHAGKGAVAVYFEK